MAKTKMRNKAYRPKPVHRIPPILLGIEASSDRLNKLTAVARNALLKLHYEAAEEGDYLILTRTLFVGHRLTKNGYYSFEVGFKMSSPTTIFFAPLKIVLSIRVRKVNLGLKWPRSQVVMPQ